MKAVHNKDRSRLIAAVLGKRPVDLTIENIRLVNVITGEIYPASVDIADGMIVMVRDNSDGTCPYALERFDGEGKYLIPGFIDTHVHVESTMMVPENFARAVLPWGTTTVVSDPHEIANVMGVEGVMFMLENAKKAPLRHYMLASPCVPSVPGKEDSGCEFTEKEIGFLLDQPGIIGIAELMNYVDICHDDQRMHRIIEEGIKRGAFLQGHAPRLRGSLLAAYRLAGPVSDHECRSGEEAKEKTRIGMHVNLKTSSLSNHLPEALKGVKEQRWNDNVSLCTDDVHAQVIHTEGHLNRVVGRAVTYGADPVEAIRFATYNAAREYGFEDLGAIAPGYAADLQLVDQLDGRRPACVWIEGRMISREGRLIWNQAPSPLKQLSTVHLSYLKTPDDFLLKAPDDRAETLVIHSRCDGPFNRAFYEKLPIENRCVDLSADPDLAYVCVCNRHGKEQKTISVIRGFGVRAGAFAATVAHDCHNLVVIYRNAADALLAAQKIEEMGGGFAYAEGGEIIGSLPLPIAGIMSPLTCDQLAEQVGEMERIVGERCSGNWLLKHATICLAALPGAVITDRGIVDGDSQDFLKQFRTQD
ncbi:amidohydrolase family protein [Clostridium sp. MCC353]|uniref:adenine deaminase n=1 Tax=Clostridium sp. MCC353 TaxID=2592646 RepID=UPI001C02F75C|nr:adenine deaminase C-terminal domain-containing protein [Clostridium sp. MCC353]MBT9779758.1 amidohydrolase family protein [Clostridium sp. MCC353]